MTDNTFLTPVGRLVQGDCFTPQDKDNEGRPLITKNGPNAGQPTKRWFIGVAIPKTDPGFAALWAKITAEARGGFPQLFDATGNCTRQGFAFKVIDGDGVDQNGQSYANRDGFAGHWVLKLTSGFAPKCYTAGGAAQIVDPNAIKRGYYVRVYGNVTSNGQVSKPGVYLNFNLVELVGYGPEITSGPDGATVFGGTPATQLPPGASATPVAPSTPIAQPASAPVGMPAMPGVPAATPMMPGVAMPTPSSPAPTTPVQAPAAVPLTGVQPAPDFLRGPAAPPAPPVVRQMTAKAQGTYEQYAAAGWTDELLVQHGLMTK